MADHDHEHDEDSFDGRFGDLKPDDSTLKGDTKIIKENEQLRWEMMWHAMKDLYREVKSVKKMLDDHQAGCEDDRKQLNKNLEEGREMMASNQKAIQDHKVEIAKLRVKVAGLMMALSGAGIVIGMVLEHLIGKWFG